MRVSGPWGGIEYTVCLTKPQADAIVEVLRFMLTHPGHKVSLPELIDGRSWKAVDNAIRSIEEAVEHPEIYRHIRTERVSE